MGAGLGMIIFSPVFILVFMWPRSDGGSAFYAQTRIGKNGKAFKCWKFRTMAPDADQRLRTLLNDPSIRKEWEETYKLKSDPRITTLGAFLRRTSLDEVPQFFNVLKGEMSLVGPRPVVRAETRHYREHLEDYLSIRPGLTGIWQVSGRNDIGYGRRVKMDTFYVRHWSLGMDVLIMAKTILVMLSRKGAY